MNKIHIKVGIIDDDETKRTQIISCLRDYVNEFPEDIIEQYRKYELVPVEIDILPDMNAVIDDIIEKEIDVLLIDYQLSSYDSHVNYTGVGVANRADQKYLGFPVFVLTSFEADLYKKEIFDAYKVFDFERYMHDDKERIEINKKLIEQCVKRRRDIENKREELNRLLKMEGTNQEIDDRILELDEFLERSLDGDNAISKSEKKRLLNSRYEELLKLLRKVVEEED